MRWEEEGYWRKDKDGNLISLTAYKNEALDRKLNAWHLMTRGDLTLYSITGVGFFLDSYNLFIINLMSPIWAYEYWDGHYPPLLRGAVNAASNIGNIMGQLAFGFLGDAFGRKFVYGKELIICIIGTILVISLPNSISTPTLQMIWIFYFRLLMGIGIGGDYPISASIVSERSHLHTRGRLLAWIFSNQGWGTLAGSIVTIIVLECFREAIHGKGKYNQLDAVWRIQMRVALIPAFAILWPRLRMPEGKNYTESRDLNAPASQESSASITHHGSEPVHLEASAHNIMKKAFSKQQTHGNSSADKITTLPIVPIGNEIAVPKSRQAKLSAFFIYFREWRHFKTLIGTAST